MVPGTEGVQSQGKTVEETLVNIREAIELFLPIPDGHPKSWKYNTQGNTRIGLSSRGEEHGVSPTHLF